MLAAFLAALFFAISAICAHRTARMVGGFAANFARLWVAAAMLAAWAHVFGSGLHGAGLPVFVLSGMVGFGMGDLGLFAALPLLGTRLTALMVQCLAAPIAAAIEWLWLGTRLDALELGCGAAILVGVGVALAPESVAGRSFSTGIGPHAAGDRARGLVFGVIAALGQAGGAVISREAYSLSTSAGLSIDGGTAAYQRALGGLCVVSTAYFLSRRGRPLPHTPAARWKPALPWIVANSLAGAAIGVSCYQWALATTPSAIVLPIVALTPLVVVPFAFFIEHERPSGRSLFGGVLAVAAAAILAHSRQGR